MRSGGAEAGGTLAGHSEQKNRHKPEHKEITGSALRLDYVILVCAGVFCIIRWGRFVISRPEVRVLSPAPLERRVRSNAAARFCWRTNSGGGFWAFCSKTGGPGGPAPRG